MSSADRREDAPPRKSADPDTLAVLPFVNAGDNAGDDYFSQGLTEELMDRLARAGGLARGVADFSVRAEGKESGRTRSRRDAGGRFPRRRQRASRGRSTAHQRATRECSRRLSALVGDVRSAPDRRDRHPGGDRAIDRKHAHRPTARRRFHSDAGRSCRSRTTRISKAASTGSVAHSRICAPR